MMIGIDEYKKQLEGKSFEELIHMRNDLEGLIKNYKLESDVSDIDPSPDVIFQMNKEFLQVMEQKIKDVLLSEIQRNVKEIWKKDIRNDYMNGRLLKEDTLKNSFYFHLRRRMDDMFKAANVVVFTEFRLKGLNQIADIAIVKIDSWNPGESEKNLEDSVIDIIAVFELKYKSYSKQIEEAIYHDRDKIHQYVESYKYKYPNCRYYYVILYEELVDPFFWMDAEDRSWAQGRVTELASGYVDKESEMIFDIQDF